MYTVNSVILEKHKKRKKFVEYEEFYVPKLNMELKMGVFPSFFKEERMIRNFLNISCFYKRRKILCGCENINTSKVLKEKYQ